MDKSAIEKGLMYAVNIKTINTLHCEHSVVHMQVVVVALAINTAIKRQTTINNNSVLHD